MKLSIAVEYTLRMCMKEDNPGLKISKEIIQGRKLFVLEGVLL